MSVLTKAKIQKAEENAVKNGAFSYLELMFIAGSKAATAITEKFNIKNKKIAILCGTGNNGGDGFVIADLLSKAGAEITVITPFGTPSTENANFYYSKIKDLNITDFFVVENNYDIIVDALFGIGFSREANSITKELFNSINHSPAIKISIDIPSGVVCDNGKVFETAISADLTLTFIALKPCFLLPNGNDYCGEVQVLDIGVPTDSKDYNIIKKPFFEKRKHNSHKGTYGTALLICGSYGMAGAAMLSAKSALRSGVGIVKCLLPKSIYSPFTTFLPEAVCIPSEENQNGILRFDSAVLTEHLKKCDAILLGCGLGCNNDIKNIAEFVIKNTNKPLIIDADGINAIVDSIDILKTSNAPIILTPHPGEMARLCKTTIFEIESNRIFYAKKFATEYNVTLVLKGSNTLVAHPDGNISFNVLGNAGMATGGTGDVLAGITVSLLAQGVNNPAEAAVYLHSSAGDKAALKRNIHSLLPTDIIDEL